MNNGNQSVSLAEAKIYAEKIKKDAAHAKANSRQHRIKALTDFVSELSEDLGTQPLGEKEIDELCGGALTEDEIQDLSLKDKAKFVADVIKKNRLQNSPASETNIEAFERQAWADMKRQPCTAEFTE